jgi:hypothetical protein
MKHRPPSRHVRLPLVGLVPTGVLLGVGCGVGLLLAAVLVTLAPLWMAHHDATAAADELHKANTALASGQTGDAQEALATARRDVDDAQGHVNGLAADMWSHFPVLGPAVHDGRHLVAALDQATTAADIGVTLIHRATAPGSHLIEGNRVNVPEIEQLAHRAQQIAPHLADAKAQIARMQADEPLIGGKIASLQEDADDQLATTTKSYQQVKPLLQALPGVLGAKEPKTYLLAIMNPSEQRFSGGATLQMATISFDDGVMSFGRSQSVADVDHAKPFLNWPPVKGNIFHPPGQPRRLASATYSPWWQISGEELLRAWQAQTGQRCQGLIAVDLQAIAALFRITGPMQVPHYGELNADNLVETLARDYDNFQDFVARRRLNNALVPAFREKFLNGEDFVQKGRSLQTGARGRDVAMYFRDERAQKAFAHAGFAGNLSTTRHDYLGVFTQNLNGSKSDYWQSRQVDMHVDLQPDGSAREHLKVVIDNPSPPYTEPTPDPKTGYLTRWLGAWMSVWFPPNTRLDAVTADGVALPHASLTQTSTELSGVVDRPVLRHTWLLAPQGSGELTATYVVPRAATVDRADGDMTYQVDLDPQDLVHPQSNTITLAIPDGYRFGELPKGWSLTDAQTAVLQLSQLTQSGSWRVPVVKD